MFNSRVNSLIEFFRALSLFIVVFFLTRFFPLGDNSIIMNVFLLLFYCLSLNFLKDVFANRLTLFSILFFTFFACYSLFLGNEPTLVFRFYLILMLLFLAYFISFRSWKLLNAIFALYVIQAVVLAVLGIGMFIYFGTGDYSQVRNLFHTKEYGDIYTFGSGFYRVQLRGNALIPFFFMLSFYLAWLGKAGYKSISLIMIVGVVFAGNFAYYISVCMFFLFFFFITVENKSAFKKFLFYFILFLIIVFLFGVDLFLSILDTKIGGSDSSLGVRVEQLIILMDDLGKSTTSLFFGNGLGNTVNIKTDIRDYSNAVYYEVQAAYMLNQLGFLFFIFLIVSFFMLTIIFISDSILRLIFICYIAYAITNPYIFDTNHVLVILILVSLNKMLLNPRRRMSCC